MGRIIETGEMTVSGSGSLKIKLAGKPRRVVADFVDSNEVPAPCSIPQIDKLEYAIASQRMLVRRQYFLVVQYEVHSVRTIKWTSYED